MALDSNAYGAVADVAALTRLYTQGETNSTGDSVFNTTTWPTGAEVEGFINRSSGALNLAMSNAGFSVPVAQADALRACEEWVIERAAALVEFSQPTAAFGESENRRAAFMSRLYKHAVEFVKANQVGFQNLGVSVGSDDSEALIFTAQDVQANRSDPANTSLEQPNFRRGQFDA